MSNAATSTKDKNLLYAAIYLIIVALFFFVIPPLEPITQAGMRVLGIFFAAIFSWSFVQNEIWPSLLTFLLLPFTGLINFNGLMGLTWGTDTFLVIILMMILVAYLEASGVTTFVAPFLMSRKFLLGHPWRLIFILFLISWLLSAFTNPFSGVLITWGFIYSICHTLDYKPYERFSTLMIFGAGVMGAISLSTLPWANNALVILSSYAQSSGTTVNYVHYLAFSIPFCLLSILGYMAICKFIFRLDVSRLKDFKPDFIKPEDLALTPQRKIALIATGFLILLLLLPGLLPDCGFKTFLNSLGLSLKVIFVFIMLSMIRVEHKPVFNFAELASKGLPWNMLMMSAAILAFVNLLADANTGINAFMVQTLGPLFQNSSLIFFFFITVLVTVLLTNFTVNMVVAVIVISAVIPVAGTLGILPLQIVYLITIVCTIAFMLPTASVAALVIFSNTQWIRAKDIYLYCIPTIILLSLIAIVWNVIFFMF